jgi:3-oxoadipate enol-lactonase
MPFLERPDARIHFDTHGDGRPVLFVMGLGADAEGWARQVRAVAPGRRAIVLDNRGVGRSSRSRRLDYSIAATAADAVALIDHLGCGPAHVVGISLGGVVAEVMAIQFPDRVRSLVLAATFARPDPALWRGAFATSLRIARWLADPRPPHPDEGRIGRAVMRGWMPGVFSPAFARDNEAELREMVLGAVRRGVRAEVAMLQLAAVLRHDVCAALAAVHHPALVLAGSRDPMVPLARCEELARVLPRARLEVLEGGHGLNVEASEGFNRAMLAFLDDVERSSPGPTRIRGRSSEDLR